MDKFVVLYINNIKLKLFFVINFEKCHVYSGVHTNWLWFSNVIQFK